MKLRGLIVGAGMAGTAVADGMVNDGRAEPVAFVETSAERRAELAEKFPGAEIVDGDGFDALLAKVKPDMVCDGGPDWLHAEHTIKALEAGCHVMIEKPMCTSADEARAIRAAEAKTDRVVMVDYTMRYSHPWGSMMVAARQGQVGDVFYLGGIYIHDMYDWFAADGKCRTPWRTDAKHPQNTLLGGGCHGLDLIQCIMGEDPIVEVTCYANHLSGSAMPMEDLYLVAMKFASGVVGKIFVTTGCNRGDFGPMLEVYGTDGTLVDGKLLKRGSEPQELDKLVEVSELSHSWDLTVRDWLDAIDGTKPNEMNTLFGARNIAVFDAAMKGLREGGTQAVEWFE